MQTVKESPLIMVYYNFRGQLQPIRNMLCYLDVPFYEIHLQNFEAQKNNLPSEVLHGLKGIKIDKTKLPMMIQQDIIVYEVYPMLSYLCYRYEREDLLGKTNEQKARVQQILEMYTNKQPSSMVQIFRMADFVYEHPDDPVTILIEQDESYDYLMDNPGYMREICEIMTSYGKAKYILGDHICIIDFVFIQSTIYINGALGVLINHREEVKGRKQKRRPTLREGKKDNLKYIILMREYRDRMMREPFYQKNKEFLESFSMISSFTSDERAQGLRKYWTGDAKFIR